MIHVFGASDDLIEFRGDLKEEMYASYKEDDYIIFSTGVVLKVAYDGTWSISVVSDPNERVGIVSSVDLDSKKSDLNISEYTDLASFEPTDDIKWIAKAGELMIL